MGRAQKNLSDITIYGDPSSVIYNFINNIMVHSSQMKKFHIPSIFFIYALLFYKLHSFIILQ